MVLFYFSSATYFGHSTILKPEALICYIEHFALSVYIYSGISWIGFSLCYLSIKVVHMCELQFVRPHVLSPKPIYKFKLDFVRRTYTEISSGLWGVKRGRCLELTTFPPSVSRLSNKVRSLTSRNRISLHGLLRDSFSFKYIILIRRLLAHWTPCVMCLLAIS
jgi:hypothetical protein